MIYNLCSFFVLVTIISSTNNIRQDGSLMLLIPLILEEKQLTKKIKQN